jgi:hypothetical protein
VIGTGLGQGAALPFWAPVVAGQSREEAATLVWELTSFRVWDDLVNESGLAPGRYAEIIAAAALAALTSPIGEQASTEPARRHRSDAAAARTRHHTA